MPILKKDPAKAEAKAAERAEAERRKAEEDFWNSPAGHARSAKAAGRRFFQIQLPIEQTTRVPMMDSHRTARQDASGLLESIETEGWTLFDVGYVFQPSGSVSRDKLLSTGQTQVIAGAIVGIYLFRAQG